MLKGLGEMGQILKIQKEFKNVQKTIQKSEHSFETDKQEVRVVMNGEYKLSSVTLDESFISLAKPADIEKKIREAVNGAVDKVKAFSNDEMKKLTGGLDIPGLGGLFK